MRRFDDISIKHKLRALLLLTSIVMLLLVTAAFVANDIITFRRALVRETTTLADVIGTNSTAALTFEDQKFAEKTLAALGAVPHVLSAAIHTQDGKPFARYQRHGAPENVSPAYLVDSVHSAMDAHTFHNDYLELSRPIILHGNVIGTVSIRSDLRELQTHLQRAAWIVIAILLSLSIVACLLSALLQRVISQPILHLAHTMENISHEKNYSIRVEKTRNDELGTLIDGFNGMLTQIQVRDERLEQHSKQLEVQVAMRTAELSQTNQDLVDAVVDIQKANLAKSAFLANMSHELRTPLHGILSFADFGLQKATTAPPAKLLGYFEHINASGRVLLTLLDDLLDLAKLESGKMIFDFQPANLNPLLSTIANEFHALLSERQLQVACHTLPERAEVSLDTSKMLQVLRNLLGNAIKFSPPHGLIELRVEQRVQSILVTVSDQGVGIPAGEEDAIFDKFIQSSKTKTGAGGTGLGLSICHEIIAAHQGRIWAENRPEGGAVFCVELPHHRHHRRATDSPRPASPQKEAA